MTDFDNTNRGVLFKNERKEKDTHPDMTGSINVNGKEHWFSGWWKTHATKGDFLSLSIGEEKQPKEQPSRPSGPPSRGGYRR